jgi:hypothetical protein
MRRRRPANRAANADDYLAASPIAYKASNVRK